MIALEKGRVAQQGTYEAVADSGYDLTGTLSRVAPDSPRQEPEPSGSSAKNVPQATEEGAGKAVLSLDVKPPVDDEEFEEGEDRSSLLPYQFYVRHTGPVRVFVASLGGILFAGASIGLQVRILCPFKYGIMLNRCLGLHQSMVGYERPEYRRVAWRVCSVGFRWDLYRVRD